MSRIVSVVALLVVAAAGCGGAARPQRPAVRGLPRSLAQSWETQAAAIARASSAGKNCLALHLATFLRSEVAASKDRLPLRLRSPLRTGVSALADRITCTPPAAGVPREMPQPPPEHGDHGDHGRHGNHGHHGRHGHGKGDGGGNDR